LNQNTNTKLKKTAMKTTLKRISTKLFCNLLIALGPAATVFAQGEAATGQVSGVQNGSIYDYTITLNNTSASVSIGSFWYSWTPDIPPYFYLPTTPAGASAPAGWAASVDANSIQYYLTSGTPLGPGQSIQFQYTASFSPAQLTGDAGYSYVYSGSIEGDPGSFINIQTVAAPEPSIPGLLAGGFLGVVLAGRLKPRKPAIAV
jgi:hypothetical protein